MGPHWAGRSLILLVGNGNSARSFSDRSFFFTPLGSWTSAPSGHGCPHRNACFSRISRAWPKFLPPGRPLGYDIRPRNLLFGLLFRSWSRGSSIKPIPESQRFCEIPFSVESQTFSWTECPQDRWDTSTGRKRLKWGCMPLKISVVFPIFFLFLGDAPKERRRRRAEKRLSKRMFLESPFLLFPPPPPQGFQDLSDILRTEFKGAEKKRTLQKHPFGQPFSARRLRRSFGALWFLSLRHEQSRGCHRIFTIAMRERPPGLIQHVLTVLVFWCWVLLQPQLPPSSRSLRLFLCASILLHGPLDIFLNLLPATPLPPVQEGGAHHKFYNTGATRRSKLHIGTLPRQGFRSPLRLPLICLSCCFLYFPPFSLDQAGSCIII